MQVIAHGVRLNRLLIATLLVTAALFFFLRTKADPDLWGHLKFGRDIYESRGIPRYDTYSYSFYGKGCVNHEWLSELIFYSVFRTGKARALVVFKFLVSFVITALLYASFKKKIRSLSLMLFFIIMPLAVISYGFGARTQIFTYLLFTITLLVIKKVDGSFNDNLLLLLPPIFLFWCNFHGGFVAGGAVFALYFLFRLVKGTVTTRLTVSAALSIFATLVNPYGIGLWRFLAGTMATPLEFIDEWRRVSLSPEFIGYFILVFTAMAVSVFSKRKPSLYEFALLAFGAYFSFKHNRHVVLFAVIFSVVMPGYTQSFVDQRLKRLKRRISAGSLRLVYLSFSVFFVFGTFFNSAASPFEIEVPPDEYPVGAVKFLSVNGIGGNILPWFDWGEMCIGELSGANKVFFDGRYGILYSDDFMRKYFDLVYCRIGYDGYLSRFPETDIALLHKALPLARALLNDKRWVAVYSSPTAIVFLKDNDNNRKILERLRVKGLLYPKLPEPYYY